MANVSWNIAVKKVSDQHFDVYAVGIDCDDANIRYVIDEANVVAVDYQQVVDLILPRCDDTVCRNVNGGEFVVNHMTVV